MTDVHELQQLLRNLADEASSKLASLVDRRLPGEREGQYDLDLAVDEPIVNALLEAGLGVLSEEAGVIEPDRNLLAIVDPVDGSTNASRSIPWCALSVCILDDDGPLVALVDNLITRERFEAIRGQGAFHNGEPLVPPTSSEPQDRLVLVNGTPPKDRPWAQFRCFGASALDISYVVAGRVDGYVDFDDEAHGVWDYAAALLLCTELGISIADAFGRDLIHRIHTERRTPVVANDPEAFEQLLATRIAQK